MKAIKEMAVCLTVVVANPAQAQTAKEPTVICKFPALHNAGGSVNEVSETWDLSAKGWILTTYTAQWLFSKPVRGGRSAITINRADGSAAITYRMHSDGAPEQYWSQSGQCKTVEKPLF